MRTKIIGTGSCLGDHTVTNDDLAGIVETSDEWIKSRTGISKRQINTKYKTWEMAARAALSACDNAGITPADLDFIVVATTTPDCCFPSVACQVQGAIGALKATAFDLSAACTGFIFALNTVYGLFHTGTFRYGLVIGVDDLSKTLDWTDRSTCVLFGDGAGAVVAEAADQGAYCCITGSDGSKSEVLTCTARTGGNFLTGQRPELGYLYMDGQAVFKFAVKKVPENIHQVLETAGLKPEQIKYYVLHQANRRIIESVAKRLKEPMDKFPMNMERYGNTSAATIPVLLDELNREQKLNRGDLIILAGFGAGLTWGATLIEW